MNIDYFKYSLTPIKKLNRFVSGERNGVLFRLGQRFYVDYHPWAEFGDVTVDELLDAIKIDNKIPAFLKQNVELDQSFTEIDHKSFYNHCLIHKYDTGIEGVVKVKYMGSVEHIINFIRNSASTQIRIDFNNGSKLNDIKQIWDQIGMIGQKKIEYMEDVFLDNNDKLKDLKSFGIPLAADRNEFNHNYKFNIVKPNVDLIQLDGKQIFSSYMGHDLGRYHCYLSLMRWGDLELFHGIDTPNIYSDQRPLFLPDGNKFKINLNEINSMYKELKELAWKPLI